MPGLTETRYRSIPLPAKKSPEKPLSYCLGRGWHDDECGHRPPRGLRVCRVCQQRAYLDRHHLVPHAAGGRGEDNYIPICVLCHRLAHRLFGPGHAYTGPTERDAFVAALRAELEAQERRIAPRSGPVDAGTAVPADHAKERGW